MVKVELVGKGSFPGTIIAIPLTAIRSGTPAFAGGA
jgi:hypothetical protein